MTYHVTYNMGMSDTRQQTKAATAARLEKQQMLLRKLYADWKASGLTKTAYAAQHGTTRDRLRRAIYLVESEAIADQQQLSLPYLT